MDESQNTIGMEMIKKAFMYQKNVYFFVLITFLCACEKSNRVHETEQNVKLANLVTLKKTTRKDLEDSLRVHYKLNDTKRKIPIVLYVKFKSFENSNHQWASDSVEIIRILKNKSKVRLHEKDIILIVYPNKKKRNWDTDGLVFVKKAKFYQNYAFTVEDYTQ